MTATARQRELRYFLWLAGFGLLVLPLAIYMAGVMTLGPYAGGLPSFLGALYKSFFTLTPSAWLLLLGPYVGFMALRYASRPLRKRR